MVCMCSFFYIQKLNDKNLVLCFQTFNLIVDVIDILYRQMWLFRHICRRSKATTRIDEEYAVMASKLEVCIVYGLISPYILFIASIAILSNYYFYFFVTSKYQWKINQYTVFPINAVIISIILQQVFIMLFVNGLLIEYIKYPLIGCIIVIDIIYVGVDILTYRIANINKRRRRNQRLSATEATHSLVL